MKPQQATLRLPAINLEDYRPKFGNYEEFKEMIVDPVFRICNLYSIKNANGISVRFKPNYPQRVVLYHIYKLGWRRLLIPKARQLGFSTLFAIISLDETHFSLNKQASIVDQTQGHASEKLNKVRFAWEKLPTDLQHKVIRSNGKEIEWSNGGRVLGGMSARGGTNQVLHISEWGPIAFDDPARSREIATGAIPTASGENAMVFVESTHKGGKGGEWYDMLKTALETPEQHKTAKDFRVLFFPWWMEERYRVVGDMTQIDTDCLKYFHDLERKHGIVLDDRQKLFYYKERTRLKRYIFSEFPSVLEECWMAPTPGMIYAQEVDRARSSGRISDDVLYDDRFPVYTSWDIGAPENQKVWIFQVVGDRIKYLESLSGSDDCRMPAHWAKRLKEKGYSYGGHFLPHDGEIMWRTALLEAGLDGVSIVPRQVNVWDGINDSLGAFTRCWFHKTYCSGGIEALEDYHSKTETDGTSVRDVPLHNWASHYSDAFAISHQAMRHGMLIDRTSIPKRPMVSGKPVVSMGVRSEDTFRQPSRVRVLR